MLTISFLMLLTFFTLQPVAYAPHSHSALYGIFEY
jgi:hypothetical protein